MTILTLEYTIPSLCMEFKGVMRVCVCGRERVRERERNSSYITVIEYLPNI